jgi:hypothetical protein
MDTMDEREPTTSHPPAKETAHGLPWLRDLYEYFAPVRKEILERGVSEAEINADVDAAIAAVQAKRSTTG